MCQNPAKCNINPTNCVKNPTNVTKTQLNVAKENAKSDNILLLWIVAFVFRQKQLKLKLVTLKMVVLKKLPSMNTKSCSKRPKNMPIIRLIELPTDWILFNHRFHILYRCLSMTFSTILFSKGAISTRVYEDKATSNENNFVLEPTFRFLFQSNIYNWSL